MSDMKMKNIFFVGFIFIILVSGCLPDAQEKVAHSYVVRVIDGDTVILAGGERLRLIGIDTPEVRHRVAGEWVYDPEPFAIEATEYNRNLVENRSVKIEYDIEKRDRYDRLLGYLFCEDNELINKKLLRKGLATVYTFPPNVKYREKFVSAQKKAMQENIGLWKAKKTIELDEAHLHMGNIVNVEGVVKKAEIFRRSLYLFFGGEDDVVIRIPEDNFKFFLEYDIDPTNDLLGQKLSVTGRVEKQRFVQIYVDGPHQLELLP